ncbi:hypothetical protein, partial [Campylobacter helveticus]
KMKNLETIKAYIKALKEQGHLKEDEEIKTLLNMVLNTNLQSEDLKSLESFKTFFFENFKKCKACHFIENIKGLDLGYCYECNTFLNKKGA